MDIDNDSKMNLQSIIKNRIDIEIDSLVSVSDMLSLFNLNKYRLSTVAISLLVYGGFDEKAVSLLDERYKYEVDSMNEKIANNDSVPFFAKRFKEYIDDALSLKSIQYPNPFDSEVICISRQESDAKIKFTESSIYKEKLKVPT